ncbi:hypothetical protein J6590_089684 [Homalodisca vitripennis]|nr:hypothetical protein J6590_089684 [Homalodisca vitripennis]
MMTWRRKCRYKSEWGGGGKDCDKEAARTQKQMIPLWRDANSVVPPTDYTGDSELTSSSRPNCRLESSLSGEKLLTSREGILKCPKNTRESTPLLRSMMLHRLNDTATRYALITLNTDSIKVPPSVLFEA